MRTQATEPGSPRKVVVSVPWPWSFQADDELFKIVRRSNDWGASRVKRWRNTLKDAARLASKVDRRTDVIVSTGGPSLVLLVLAARLRRAASVRVVDYLHAGKLVPGAIRTVLSAGVDQFVVIRTSDLKLLARLFPRTRLAPVYMPWPVAESESAVLDGEYFYAAGWARRDWATLVAALNRMQVRAVLAPGGALPGITNPRVEVLTEMPPPAEGRRLAAASRAVVIFLEETEVAAGPLVLLDAMSMGKPVIVNDTNGNRDYVGDGVSGLVVPPGDVDATVTALHAVDADPDLRQRLGSAAHERVEKQNSVEQFWRNLREIVGH